MTQWDDEFSANFLPPVPSHPDWPPEKLAKAKDVELSKLTDWLRRAATGRDDLSPLVDSPDAVEANRLALRAWYDSETACGKCPGLRVCGAPGAGNPHPRLWAITETWVDVRNGRPWLEVAWDVCRLARAKSNNPKLVHVSGTECRVWIRNDGGGAAWREMPEPPPKTPARRKSWA